MILSKPKQLEILKTILVNIFLMVFQNQPMLGNGPASMWSLASCAGLKRPCMLAIVGHRFNYSNTSIIPGSFE
jgi:hypothetical protein